MTQIRTFECCHPVPFVVDALATVTTRTDLARGFIRADHQIVNPFSV